VPYSCARALCLTFAYDIRWALTPIFGHSFINQCVPPDSPAFQCFRIDGEIVRNAQRQAEGWKATPSRSATPDSATSTQSQHIQGTLGPTSAPVFEKTIKQRRDKPEFKHGSPFSTAARQHDRYQGDYAASPSLSPKTSPMSISTPGSSGWTSINFSRGLTSAPASNTSVYDFGSHKLNLLTNLYSEPVPQAGSWRDMKGSPAPSTNNAARPFSSNGRSRKQKRVLEDSDDDYDVSKDEMGISATTSVRTSSGSAAEVDIITSPPLSPPQRLLAPASKRIRLTPARDEPLSYSAGVSRASTPRSVGRSKIVSVEDGRAAQWLLNLHEHDSQLARGPTPAEQEAGRRLNKPKGSEDEF
jgi:hypothetical protein